MTQQAICCSPKPITGTINLDATTTRLFHCKSLKSRLEPLRISSEIVTASAID